MSRDGTPGRTLRDLSEAVMREIIGDRTVDEVITVGRQEIEITAKKKLKQLVETYELGSWGQIPVVEIRS